MFSEKRIIWLQASDGVPMPDQTLKLKKIVPHALQQFGDQSIVKGQVGDTADRAKAVVRGVEEGAKAAKSYLGTKVNVNRNVELTKNPGDLPANVPAIWNYETGKILLNTEVALCNPEMIPFWIAHETAHSAGIFEEGLADFIAAEATGIKLDGEYAGERRKVEEIAQRVKESDVLSRDGGKMVVKYRVKDNLDGLFKLLVRAFVKEGKSEEPVNDAIRLFKEAFPNSEFMRPQAQELPTRDDIQSTSAAVHDEIDDTLQ